MTPCTYDACNYQSSWEAFAALDLWNCLNFVDLSNRSEIDSHIYLQVGRVSRHMSILTWEPTMTYTFNPPRGEIIDDDGQVMTSDMNLGTTDTFEVWFLPDNRVSYSPRLVTETDNLQEANDFVAERLPDMAGTLEIVRATLCRQRVV